VCFRLRHLVAGSSRHLAESRSSSCGPRIRFRLLPTSPRGDAVTFSYRGVAYSGTDFHRADQAPSWAHNYSLRKILKGRSAFPNDGSIIKLLYMGLQHVAKKWTQPIPEWKAALNQFVMLFGERVQV
jgi:hypothetical protein